MVTAWAVGLTDEVAHAQATAVTVSGTLYTQNFDGITTGQTSSIASAAQGWSFFRSGTSSSLLTYTSGSNTTVVSQNAGTSGTGAVSSSSSGGAYLWVSGTLATGTDKSIGFLSTGSYPGPSATAAPGQQLAILFGFTNTTGATITNLDLGWNFERYREGTRAQGWEFYTSTDGSTWSANTAGNQSYTGASTSTVYNPPQQVAKSVTLPSLSIANGSSYYLRWSYVTTGSWSNAQGLGIDDFTMSLTTSGSVADSNLYWAGGAGWTSTAPGAGGDGSWADGSGSWDSSKKANFGGSAGTVTLGTVTASNGIVFTTSGYTLNGGTISLAGASSGLNTITTGTDGTVTTTINSAIAGSAGLMKMGAGTLVLGGANTFTGGLTLSSGTLQITSDSNLGDAAGAVALNGTLKTTGNIALGSSRAVSGGASLDIAPGTTLTVGGSYSANSTTLLNAGTLELQGSTRSVGTLTFNTAAAVNAAGPITVAGITASAVTSGSAVVNPAITFASTGDKTVDVGTGGTLVLGGDISGLGTGRIAKTGAGTLIASGSNATSGFRVGATGATPTNGGKVILAAAAASGTGQLQLNYGTLETTAPFTFANGLSVGGRSGAVAVLGGTNAMTFSGSSSFFRGIGTSGELRLDVNNVTTLAGVTGTTSGGGTATGITIGGTGQLIISGSAALTDRITLQDSVRLTVTNSLASAAIIVGAGNTLAGDGTVGAITTTAGATLSPGVGIGTLSAGSTTLAGGGNYNWQIYNATGTAGSADGWDLLSVGGVLNVASTSADPFKINLWSLSSTGPDVNGNAINWNSTSSGTWRIASAAGGITGFAADAFTINTAPANGTGGFANSLAGGSFSVALSGSDLNLVFTPASAPGTVRDWYGDGVTAGKGGTWTTTDNRWSNGSTVGPWNPSFRGRFGGEGGTVDIQGGGVTASAGLEFTGDGYTVTGQTLTLGGTTAADNEISVATATTATLSAPVQATQGLLKTGEGSLVLGGAVTAPGGLDVAEGVVAIGAGGTAGSVAGNISIAAGARLAFDRSDDTTFAGNLAGAGDVEQLGTGTLRLAGSGGHTGSTTVRSGKLVLENPGALASSPTTVDAGATLAMGPQVSAVVPALVNNGLVDVAFGELTVVSGLTAEGLKTQIVAGRNEGAWDGATGITSSGAAGTADRAVGWIDNGDGSFRFGYAAAGDLDMNGLVDLDDVIAFVGGGLYDTGSPAVWAQGDYDYNGIVDLDDVIAFVGGGLYDKGPYNQPVGGLSLMGFGGGEDLGLMSGGFTAVPEPSAGMLLALAVGGLLAYNLRRRVCG